MSRLFEVKFRDSLRIIAVEMPCKKMFGHTDIKTMQNIYTHLRAQKLEAERNKLEMYIKQGENRPKF